MFIEQIHDNERITGIDLKILLAARRKMTRAFYTAARQNSPYFAI
jgi:hypothetical protein